MNGSGEEEEERPGSYYPRPHRQREQLTALEAAHVIEKRMEPTPGDDRALCNRKGGAPTCVLKGEGMGIDIPASITFISAIVWLATL